MYLRSLVPYLLEGATSAHGQRAGMGSPGPRRQPRPLRASPAAPAPPRQGGRRGQRRRQPRRRSSGPSRAGWDPAGNGR